MRKIDGGTTYPAVAVTSDWLAALRERWQEPSADQSLEARLHGRPVQVRMSRAARSVAKQLSVPLIVEMELYFSCLVRKAVRFHTLEGDADPAGLESIRLSDNLILRFRPVTTQHCALPAGAAAPPLEAMPVARPQAFVPHWLKIDFHHGEWLGEFGY